MFPFRCEYDMPTRPIQETLRKQETVFEDVLRKNGCNAILFAEHEPVYTYVPGKPSEGRLLRNGSPETLRAPLVPVHRGGSITYHGPGQLVCYFIWNLTRTKLGIYELNDLIDASTTALLARYGISGEPKPDALPTEASGVWVRGKDGVSRKIASRGLRVAMNGTRSITRFGCALNLSTDLRWFDAIYPCGLDIEMTSVERETGQCPDVRDAALAFAILFSNSAQKYQE